MFMQNPNSLMHRTMSGPPIGMAPKYLNEGTLTVLDGKPKTKEDAARQIAWLRQRSAEERAARTKAIELMERSACGELLTDEEMDLIRAYHQQ